MGTVDGKLPQQSSGILLHKYQSQQRMSSEANSRAGQLEEEKNLMLTRLYLKMLEHYAVCIVVEMLSITFPAKTLGPSVQVRQAMN